MEISALYPYRSEAARERCFAYLDALAARHWPSESQERIVKTTYGNTFVRITGLANAPPLALLHGAGATSLMWWPNVRALSEQFLTVAVDQVGEYGKGHCPGPIHNIAEFVAWLDELFNALGLSGGINLAGRSYGGALAAQYALRFPQRLAKLVLLAPGNTVLRCGPQFWARLLVGFAFKRKGIPAFMRWVFPVMATRDPAWVDSIVEEFFLTIDSMVRRQPVMPPVLTDGEWRSLAVPTLFLVGEYDGIYSPEKAVARLKRVAPSVKPRDRSRGWTRPDIRADRSSEPPYPRLPA